LSQDFRGRGRPWGIFVGFYKTRHILLSDSANCTVLRAVVLTQYRCMTDGRTDGRTDGIAVASTAVAMRALWRAVKNKIILYCQAEMLLMSTTIPNVTMHLLACLSSHHT